MSDAEHISKFLDAAYRRTRLMPTRPQTLKYRSLSARYSPPQQVRALPTNSREWLAIRKRILIRDLYTCQKCGGYGNEVDHKDGNDAHNEDSNYQTLCRPCHSLKTSTENGGFGNRRTT